MKIKFVAPDPRRGTVAQMDSSRGQQLIDAGAAILINEDGTDKTAQSDAPVMPVVSEVQPISFEPKPKRKVK